MMSDKIKELTKQEWRELGFYYDRDDNEKLWKIVASKNGVTSFINLLYDFSNKFKESTESEHEHYGPYFYLEIMLWNCPSINKHCICGSHSDMIKLAKLIEGKNNESEINSVFYIGNEFSSECEYKLAFYIKYDDFDPAKEDNLLWK